MRRIGRRLAFWRGAIAAILVLAGASSPAQEIESLKQAVVRILSHSKDGISKTGTGFIVKIAPDVVHIVTATHVVQGAEKIEIEFFAKRDALVPAKVGRMEDDSLRGIAYLVVGTSAPAGARALALAPQIKLSEGSDEAIAIGLASRMNAPQQTAKLASR